MIIATQRPSVDVITGVIKANFPARISFKVASKVDSRTVLDINGADKLLGRGDMLFVEPGASKPVRAQCSLIHDSEIERITNYIRSQGAPQYVSEIAEASKKSATGRKFDKDEVYEEAVRLILESKQASVSVLQRRLGLGYTRAARLIDMMEDEGIVGPYQGSKPRDLLISLEDYNTKNGQ
jgi:S-DNA-T family DNA segregation ATPase FtsK/SpoIIIE